MSSSISRCIRPSPNEEAAFIEKRLKEKRTKRLLEVRHQEKEFAKQVRDNVQRKKQIEQELLEQHLKECAKKSHQMKIARLEEELKRHYHSVGQGHRDAMEIGQEEERLQELRLLFASQQRVLAKKRQRLAMEELSNSNSDKILSSRVASARATATAQERERCKSGPKNQSQTLIMELEPHLCGYLSTRRVRGVESFASTYFHLPDNLVNRETTANAAEPDANQIALQVNMEEEYRSQHLSAVHEEQKEKARLRHKHALAKLKLEKDKVAVLKDLSLLMREDRSYRQKVLQKIPNNVFQPVQDRLQQQEEEQREMEHAFEKILTDHSITVRASPSPTPTMSSGTEQPIPAPNHPPPLTPPPLPVPLTPLTPHHGSHTPPRHEQQGVPMEKPSSVVVPCGTQDLSILTITPSFSQGSHSSTDQLPDSSQTDSVVEGTHDGMTTTTNTTETSEGVSRLVGLIRSQQMAKRQELKREERGSPTLRQHPLSLSISTVSNSTDHEPESNGNVMIKSTSNKNNNSVDTVASELFTPLDGVNNNTLIEDNMATDTSEQQTMTDPWTSQQYSHNAVPYPSQNSHYYYHPWLQPSVGWSGYQYYPTNQWTQQYHPSPSANLYPSGVAASYSHVPSTVSPAIANPTTNLEPSINNSSLIPNPHSSDSSRLDIGVVANPDCVCDSSNDSYLYKQSRSPESLVASVSPSSAVSMEEMKPCSSTGISTDSPLASKSEDEDRNEAVERNENEALLRREFVNDLLSSLKASPSTPEFHRRVSKSDSPVHYSASSPGNTMTTPTHYINMSSTSSDTSYRELENRNNKSTAVMPFERDDRCPTNEPKGGMPQSLSLQEAFLTRNRMFVERSQKRVTEIEGKAKERVHSTPLAQPRHVSFSSPLIRSTDHAKDQYRVCRSPDHRPVANKEKISSKEMHQRNLRLYSQLPEVKRKQNETHQQEEYAKNRKRAKQFHQNLRLKMKEKKNKDAKS